MKRRAVVATLVVALAAAAVPSLHAHAGAHGLKVGEVVSITGDTFELNTATETLTVKLTADTKYEKDTKAVTRDLLKKGVRVGVATAKPVAGQPSVATRVVFMKAVAAPKSR